MTVDSLFELKNAYYIGNYQQCITEAQKAKSDTEEREIFMYRAYIAQNKCGVVKDGIDAASPQSLQHLKTLAEYLTSDSEKKNQIYEHLKKNTLSISEEDFVLPIVAATVYCHEKDYENALRVLHSSNNLECYAMQVQILLQMDRVDLASKKVKKMHEKDEDATLTQLAQAWINFYVGGEKLKEAYYIYQELIDKFTATPMLLNGVAVGFLSQEQSEDAEGPIQQALEKDNNNAEALINMIHLSHRQNKNPDVCNRYFSQLRDSHGNHSFVTDYAMRSNEFDKFASIHSVGRL